MPGKHSAGPTSTPATKKQKCNKEALQESPPPTPRRIYGSLQLLLDSMRDLELALPDCSRILRLVQKGQKVIGMSIEELCQCEAEHDLLGTLSAKEGLFWLFNTIKDEYRDRALFTGWVERVTGANNARSMLTVLLDLCSALHLNGPIAGLSVSEWLQQLQKKMDAVDDSCGELGTFE